MQPTIDELVVTDEPGFRRAAGFRIEGDCCEAGIRRIRLEGRGAGLLPHGEGMLAVVEAPAGVNVAHARLWGTAFLVADLDATAAFLGELLGTPHDAVQPGRRIATLRREAGLGRAIAFMSPEIRP